MATWTNYAVSISEFDATVTTAQTIRSQWVYWPTVVAARETILDVTPLLSGPSEAAPATPVTTATWG